MALFSLTCCLFNRYGTILVLRVPFVLGVGTLRSEGPEILMYIFHSF